MCTPKWANAMLLSDREHCEWIRDCLIQNNMVDYQFYPPVSWLDYYCMTIDNYQQHIPDPRLQRKQPLWHEEISSAVGQWGNSIHKHWRGIYPTQPALKIDQRMQQILPQQGGDGPNYGHTPLGDKPSDLAQPLPKAVLPQPKVHDVTPALQPQ